MSIPTTAADSRDETTWDDTSTPALGLSSITKPERHRRTTSDIIPGADAQELDQIVASVSRRMTASGGDKINPVNSKFDIREWLRWFIDNLNAAGLDRVPVDLIWENLTVSGSGQALELQHTFSDILLKPFRLHEKIKSHRQPAKQILHSFDGLATAGDLVIVLGRPGSGCSTYLKTLCGELHGLELAEPATISLNGIPQKHILKEFKGDMIYNQEVDKHFPHLTVHQTLSFAAAARTPQTRLMGMSRQEFVQNVVSVVMAICGLTHTSNTKIGNDFIRGVSGGERKRVSIAEMMVAGSSLSAWDNSTRGLDSASALKFVQNLRLACDLGRLTNLVAIYQASQAIYDLFDKAAVLYEGRQIYFGPASEAESFFEEQGWLRPPRQTTADFLTAVTNPSERKARPGMENKVPHTAEEFEKYWRLSPHYKKLQVEIAAHKKEKHLESAKENNLTEMREAKAQVQARHARPGSAYTVTVAMQIAMTTKRAYQRIWGDRSATFTMAVSNIVIALIVGSLYYGSSNDTSNLTSKASVIFVAILTAALGAISEIGTLYAQRPIVQKHKSYRLYHPATEALAGLVADIPIKFINTMLFDIVLYFLAGLRSEAGPFFLFFLITYVSVFVMSAIFRLLGAASRTVSQAMGMAGVLILALVIYTGFVISPPSMHPWFGWIRWINPIYYAFEILVSNEFHNRQFQCSSFIPGAPGSDITGDSDSLVCSALGAVAGQTTVDGDAYIYASYGYEYAHVWRNFGILIAFLVAFIALYLLSSEFQSDGESSAEMLVFPRGLVPAHILQSLDGGSSGDIESRQMISSKQQGPGENHAVQALEAQRSIFTWSDVTLDIEIKGEPRRLLDHISGWVKPGSLTALMGVSGAGKTTLLDALAQRTSIGVLTGDMLVNGRPLPASFQRQTGYVQQQDLHLQTSTVRESLRFSALMRQPSSVSKQSKLDFVEDVIRMLNMEDFADAVVGISGEGLNVEQRKLLTIGVELAAKPQLLLFLDEPTSGLDSQSSWAICAFLRKLANAGQAVLCTIHQPSATLFQEFDRLLFLAQGGRTVYFGDIGQNSQVLLDYFSRNGARACGSQENPAEYMLELVNQITTENQDKRLDWHQIWKESPECAHVIAEIKRLNQDQPQAEGSADAHHDAEFATPLPVQLQAVTYRLFQQYWRTPSYIIAKLALGAAAGLFIGFSFYLPSNDYSQTSMSNILYAIFMITTIFTSLVQQIQPLFVTQRSLYEVRERPSKAYSWKAFLIGNIVVEIPYQVLTGIICWACTYYPTAGIQSSDRQGLVLLYFIQFFVYASTFAHMTIAAMPDEQTASAIVTLLMLMSLMFCGVLQAASALPRFWIFMYRASPFTYWIGGIVATELHARPIVCTESEMSLFSPPSGQTCLEYMAEFLSVAPGLLQNPDSTSDCQYCSISVADTSLEGLGISWNDRWRNFGIVWAFIVFNVFITVTTYYAFRVATWKLPRFTKK